MKDFDDRALYYCLFAFLVVMSYIYNIDKQIKKCQESNYMCRNMGFYSLEW